MDSLTAGVSIIPLLLCMAFAIFGIWLVDRKHADGAQHWAAAIVLICVGVSIVVVTNNGKNQPAVLILANGCVVAAAILQYWGLRRFFGRPRERLAAAVGFVFLVLYSGCILFGADAASRAMVYCVAIACMMSLSLWCVLRSLPQRRSLGGGIVMAALSLVIAGCLLRIMMTLNMGEQIQPNARAIVSVVLIYIVPLASTVFYSVGLLMLYFERSLREQRHLATHDALTGILNRRAVVEAGEAILAEAERAELPLTVAIIDIDHFKRVNDELGHHAGDQVLTDVAGLLAAQCRRRDVLGRYGGEEFLMICTELPAADCASFGDRLLASIHQYRYQLRHPVTISIGFAWRQAGDSWHSLTSRADAELYRAKIGGRDRYCLPAHLQAVNALPVGVSSAAFEN